MPPTFTNWIPWRLIKAHIILTWRRRQLSVLGLGVGGIPGVIAPRLARGVSIAPRFAPSIHTLHIYPRRRHNLLCLVDQERWKKVTFFITPCRARKKITRMRPANTVRSSRFRADVARTIHTTSSRTYQWW